MCLAPVVAVGLAACGFGGSPSPGDADRGAGTVPASSSNVSFVVDGTTTYGTLEIPTHRSGQRLPAALLIAGSGPTDRNGNDGQLGVSADTLGLIAGILARQGIMTFRYDKYFTGQTGPGTFASDPAAITMTSFLHMADAAYNFLRSRPQSDPHKMLVVGHSEGGMIALSVADSVTDKPAGLALLEPQDERSLDIVNLQTDEAITKAVGQGQLSVAQARSNAGLVRQAISQFRARQPFSTKGMAPFVVQFLAVEGLNPSTARFEFTDDEIYPPTLAAKVKRGTRVLVTDGTRDTNIPPSTIGPLVRALKGAGTTGPGFKLLQGTDHEMHLPTQPDTSPLLAPAAITAIQEWAHPFATNS